MEEVILRFVTIGDIHGKDVWIDMISESVDFVNEDVKVIFIGDYVDSFNETDSEIIDNLKRIIELKREFPSKVELLLGNHDIQYHLLHNDLHLNVRCTGFRNSIAEDLFQLFTHNKDIFKVAYQYKNYLWTHAGISNFAYRLFFQNKLPKNKLEWADELNRLYIIRDESLFHISRIRGGSSQVGSIFWADMSETMRNPVDNLHQIVGHSKIAKIYTEVIDEVPDTSITFTDCLDSTIKLYSIEIE